jgi:aminoglycoside phosphotransferase family enzyme/predicted kinase
VVESQEAIFALLADPATHGGNPVTRIDTHAASVFLAGGRALKVKRAVRFPFLDYATLDRRKGACSAELEVNRPFSANLYCRIAPITRELDGSLAFDGDGTPVEWAVVMRRFDETQTLDRVADAHGIGAELADALGRTVAAAHRQTPKVDPQPWIDALRLYIDQNDTAFRERPDLFVADDAEALTRMSRDALARLEPLLARRGALGLVRRGHGDLHLGNIALIDGAPVPFDAIEFDALIASGDVLYDLAFLLMDLIERRQPAAANIVLNRYLVESARREDLEALAALPLFMSLRAAIRAKVTAARLAHAASLAQPGIAAAAQTYFRLAGELLRPPAPKFIALGGLSGTGKSALARALAPELGPAPGAVVLRSDILRKQRFHIGETARLPPDAYAADVSAQVYATLIDDARTVIAAGHSVIVDAVFARADERQAIAAAARATHSKLHGLFLVADLDTRLRRIGARAHDASDADAAVARQQEGYDLGALAWTRIDAAGTLEQTLAHAREALRA